MNLFDVLDTLYSRIEKYRTESEIMGKDDPNYPHWIGRLEAYEDCVSLLLNQEVNPQS